MLPHLVEPKGQRRFRGRRGVPALESENHSAILEAGGQDVGLCQPLLDRLVFHRFCELVWRPVGPTAFGDTS